MYIPYHITESLETLFWVILKFFNADADPGSGIFLTLNPGSGIFLTLNPGSGMQKFGSILVSTEVGKYPEISCFEVLDVLF
jgi:hypothetical protein